MTHACYREIYVAATIIYQRWELMAHLHLVWKKYVE